MSSIFGEGGAGADDPNAQQRALGQEKSAAGKNHTDPGKDEAPASDLPGRDSKSVWIESPPDGWPPEFEAAIREQTDQLDTFRASDEGRHLAYVVAVLGQEVAEAESSRREAELLAARAEHSKAKAERVAEQERARADASAARTDSVIRAFNDPRLDGQLTADETPDNLPAAERAGLPSGVVLDLFGDAWGGRSALGDALTDAKWAKEARIAAGRRGKGGEAIWDPLLPAELITKRRANARSTVSALDRAFRVDPRLRPWRDAWESRESPAGYFGLNDRRG